jgi:hypothetical protein
MAVKPLSPAEIVAKRVAAIPDGIITELNEFLVQAYKPGQSVAIHFGLLNKWLTAENMHNGQSAMRETIVDLFRDAWIVTERIADANEDFEPYYTFAAPTPHRNAERD